MIKCENCQGERIIFYHGEVCICADCSDGASLSNFIVSLRSSNKQMQEENEELKTLIKAKDAVIKTLDNMASNEIRKIKEENAMMREALEFYADRENWQSVYVGYGDKSQIKGYDLEDLSCDDRPDECGGKRAREVLAQLTKGE